MGEDFWPTTLTGIRQKVAWNLVAHYLEPVRRFLATRARYRWIPEADRDDLAQEIVVAIWERGQATFDAKKSPFRAFLQGVIRHKVADYVRRANREPVPLDAIPETPDEAPTAQAAVDREHQVFEAVEFSAKLVMAIQTFHDRCKSGPAELQSRLYCFIDRLIGHRSESEIARREGLSRDQVKRHLAAARREIIAELVHDLTGRRASKESYPEPVLQAILRCTSHGLREPARALQWIERESDPRVREASRTVLAAILGQRRYFFGASGLAWEEFLHGLAEVFQVDLATLRLSPRAASAG